MIELPFKADRSALIFGSFSLIQILYYPFRLLVGLGNLPDSDHNHGRFSVYCVSQCYTQSHQDAPVLVNFLEIISLESGWNLMANLEMQ